MTIVRSDDFAGLGAGSSLGGRTVNNALGGTGSETWSSGAGLGATGGGKITGLGASGCASLAIAGNGKVRVKLNVSAGTNHAIYTDSGSNTNATSCYLALYVNSNNTIRIRQHNGSGGNLGDVASVAITALATGTDYYIEFDSSDGVNLYARVFESDGTTQRGGTASYTPGTMPSGSHMGIREYSGGGTATYDDWTLDDGAGAGSPEIVVSGNSVTIADGDATPSTSDHTDFGSVVQGGTAVQRVFTVQNTGTADLTTSGLSVPSGFSIVEGLSATIAASGSDTFTISLPTTTVGTFSGDISFTNNDSDEGTFNFAITGVITSPPPPPPPPPPSGGGYLGMLIDINARR